MTLPNKLTVMRLFSAPFVFLCWYLSFRLGLAPQAGSIVIWILFGVSEVTDILDGYIARSRGLVSDVGKLMDPFSDVVLRVTYFLCFVGSGIMPIWSLAVILWRELSMMFIRMLLAREGEALAANSGGKIKSLLYFFSGAGGLAVLTLRAWFPELSWLPTVEIIAAVLFSTAAAAALISFLNYFRHYTASKTHKKFLSE